MTPQEANKVLIDAAFNRGFKEAERVGDTLARKMKKAQQKAGGGGVTLSLATNGSYYAHVYPSPTQANTAARERMEAAPKIGLASITTIVREEQQKAIATGTGRTLDAAMDMLLKNLA